MVGLHRVQPYHTDRLVILPSACSHTYNVLGYDCKLKTVAYQKDELTVHSSTEPTHLGKHHMDCLHL